MNIAIILAAGMGKRMGASKNKIFLELNKKPLIFYTLNNFEQSPYIAEIILIAQKNEILAMQKIVTKYQFKKVTHIIPGGTERQYSSHNGIKCVQAHYRNTAEIILLFHNGANPFISNQEISQVIKGAQQNGAAVVAHKTKDTIRRVNRAGFSCGVVDRTRLWNMQTPQALQYILAYKAFNRAKKDNFLGTDDVSLVERLGGNVFIVEASDNNFKVTTPTDLALAKVILTQLQT